MMLHIHIFGAFEAFKTELKDFIPKNINNFTNTDDMAMKLKWEDDITKKKIHL